MPPSRQLKLVRMLGERVVRAPGATLEMSFDMRVVAATNRDLERGLRPLSPRDLSPLQGCRLAVARCPGSVALDRGKT